MYSKVSISSEKGYGDNRYPYLLKVFTVFSTLALIAILLLVSAGIYGIYNNHIIHDAEADSINICLMLLEQEKETLLLRDSERRARIFVSREDFPGLDQRIRKFLYPLDIVKIKVFSKENEIVYSTDHTIINKIDRGNEELERSLKGEVVSKLETKEEVWDLAGEEKTDLDLVETYLPIRDRDNKIIGSFEVYVDVTRYREEVKRVMILSVAVIFIVLICVFGFFFLLMKRATGTIQRLTEKEKQLAAAEAVADMERRKAQELSKAYRELKETQNMLIQTEKMSAIGQLASGIVHDINNPLLLIKGRIELLDKSKLTDETARALETIMVQSQRIQTMVNRLLSYSKKREPVIEPLEINQLLQSIPQLLSYYPEFKKIVWKEQLQENLPLVKGDFCQLQEVFINLGLNACQAMSAGDEILIITRYNETQKCVEASVKDTGPGINQEQLDKLFEPFFTTKEKGTGLGLTICRKIIEQHKGRIEVESAPGKGTTITVKLPVED